MRSKTLRQVDVPENFAAFQVKALQPAGDAQAENPSTIDQGRRFRSVSVPQADLVRIEIDRVRAFPRQLAAVGIEGERSFLVPFAVRNDHLALGHDGRRPTGSQCRSPKRRDLLVWPVLRQAGWPGDALTARSPPTRPGFGRLQRGFRPRGKRLTPRLRLRTALTAAGQDRAAQQPAANPARHASEIRHTNSLFFERGTSWGARRALVAVVPRCPRARRRFCEHAAGEIRCVRRKCSSYGGRLNIPRLSVGAERQTGCRRRACFACLHNA